MYSVGRRGEVRAWLQAQCMGFYGTVPLARTEVCGKKNTVWSRRAAILDPKFNEEHDARISFGHRARVQQPARAGGRLPGRLPGRHPARAHSSNEIFMRAFSQISEFRSCMHEILLHACTTGWTTTRTLRFQIDCSDAALYPTASGAALTKR